MGLCLKNKTEPQTWDSCPQDECPFLCMSLFEVDLGIFVLSQWQPIPVFLTVHNAAEVITCGFQKFVQKEVINMLLIHSRYLLPYNCPITRHLISFNMGISAMCFFSLAVIASH